MAISSALALVTLWMIIRQRGGFEWLSGGKGRYPGFDNIYEMQPSTPGAQYAFQPAPQWGAQPYQQWPPQAQQWHPGAGHLQWAQQQPQQTSRESTNPGPGGDAKLGQPVFR